MDKCREEFEAWYERYCTDNGFNCNLQIMSTSSYLNSFSELCFTGWKASRESMGAIKLPNAITADNRLLGDNEYCYGYNQALRDCEKQITSAGYKVE